MVRVVSTSSSSAITNPCFSHPWQGDHTWATMLGQSVRLQPVPIQSLSELERARLQEVALYHLDERDLDFKISIPKGTKSGVVFVLSVESSKQSPSHDKKGQRELWNLFLLPHLSLNYTNTSDSMSSVAYFKNVKGPQEHTATLILDIILLQLFSVHSFI